MEKKKLSKFIEQILYLNDNFRCCFSYGRLLLLSRKTSSKAMWKKFKFEIKHNREEKRNWNEKNG